MRLKKLLLPMLVTMALANVHAAAPATLRDAVAQAVLQNPEVQFRFHDFEAAVADQRSARGAYLPRLDVNAYTGPEKLETPALGHVQDNHPYAEVRLQQLLFDGFGTQKEVEKLGYAKLSKYYDFVSASDDIALQAAQAYIDVLRFRRRVDLARENYAQHRDIYTQLAERAATGVGRKVDLEQSAGRLSLAESNWLTEESNLHDVTARYERLVGAPPPASLGAVPSIDVDGLGKASFAADAIHANPSYKSAVATIHQMRANADQQRSSYSPTLQLQASDDVERNQLGIPGRYTDRTVQLVLNWNLFNGGSDRARVHQRLQQLNTAYDLRDKSCRDLSQFIQIAYNDVAQLKLQLDMRAQYELSTAKARDAYRQQYDIGQRTLLDLLDTENELFTARRDLVSTEYDLIGAKLRLLAASGSILPTLQLHTLDVAKPDEAEAENDVDGILTCDTHMVDIARVDKSTLPPPQVHPASVQLAPAASVTPTALEAGPKAASSAESANTAMEWVTKQGDTLKSIAVHFYGGNQAARVAFIKRLRTLNPPVASVGPFAPLDAGMHLALPKLMPTEGHAK